MKRFLILLMLALALPARSQTVITATVSVTNAAGTTYGGSVAFPTETISVNGIVRTWTNTTTATGILTNSTAAGAATNMFNAYAQFPQAGMIIQQLNGTQVVFQSFPGQAMTVVISTNWSVLSYSTNTIVGATVVRVPYTVEGNAQQTNITSGLVAAIASDSPTNQIYENAPAFVNLVGRTNAQTISGNKTFTGTSNYIAGARLVSPSMTNGVNYGNSFNSPGTGNGSLQIGATANGSGTASTAIGNNAGATGDYSVGLGYSAGAVGQFATALGANAQANDTNATAVGYNAIVNLGYTNSTAIGAKAAATAANQVMLGSSGGGGVPAIAVVVNNSLTVGTGLTVGGAATNLWHEGTNTFLAGADIAFTRYPVASLANGVNAAVPIGTNVFVEVSGPTGSFSIDGINGSPNRDGKLLILLNQTGQAMTINNQSGSEPTAANRVVSLTGGNQTTAGNGTALLIYSGAASRWILIRTGQ